VAQVRYGAHQPASAITHLWVGPMTRHGIVDGPMAHLFVALRANGQGEGIQLVARGVVSAQGEWPGKYKIVSNTWVCGSAVVANT
jgi:hypothetical protein